MAPWKRGGVRSDDGWNTGYAHPASILSPAGDEWSCRCPACGTGFVTTCADTAGS